MGNEEMPEMNIKKAVINGLIWKFSERISAQLVTLFVSVILARMLLPEEYGAVAMIMVFISLANVFVSNGMGNALIQKKDADNVDFSSVFWINIILSWILYGALFVASPVIAQFYNMPVLSPALRILAIRIPVAAVNSVQQAYVSRNMLFKRFFLSSLLGTGISGAVGIYMASRGYGIWALVGQYLVNSCTDTMVLWCTVRWRPQFVCSLKRAKGLISYGWKLLASALLDTGYNQLKNLLIGRFYTADDLAYYSQGDKYPSLVVVNINASIGSVLFPVMAQYQNHTETVKNMTRRVIQVSAYILWPVMAGLIVTAKPLVRLLLTERWLPCVSYMQIFCFTYGLWPIHTANLQAIKAMGRSDLFFKMEILKKLIGVVFLVASIQYGPVMTAVSLLASGLISTVINAFPNTILLQYHIREQLSDLLKPIILSMVMGAMICPLSKLPYPDLIIIIIQVIGGGMIYLCGSVLSRQEGFYYIFNTIQKSARTLHQR